MHEGAQRVCVASCWSCSRALHSILATDIGGEFANELHRHVASDCTCLETSCHMRGEGTGATALASVHVYKCTDYLQVTT